MTDTASPIPGWVNNEGQPVTYGDIVEQVTAGATQITEYVGSLAASWEEDHDPAALAGGIASLLSTLQGYSLPMLMALVKADAVSAYIDEQAAAFTVPDTIAEEV